MEAERRESSGALPGLLQGGLWALGFGLGLAAAPLCWKKLALLLGQESRSVSPFGSSPGLLIWGELLFFFFN